MMLPGYNQALPRAAQDLVEEALLDHDLINAPADDRRWVELYDELHRLVAASTDDTSASTSNTMTGKGDVNHDVEEEEEDDDQESYIWGSSLSSEDDDELCSNPKLSRKRDTEREAWLAATLPNADLAAAVHACVSEQLTNKKGGLLKGVVAESWDPNSLAALSILVEEVVRSQAGFNARRTMFAKDPRKQVGLAAAASDSRGQGTIQHADKDKTKRNLSGNNTLQP
ncbi:uncharacterized protein MEPE_04054 [Melanopsichium pennsylvanicum]|uniref:Uncharacterized protein n=2 Tax=Melanopsichium pennsylvanicum TaxID=63383 RepID=A0AAJ4XN63_9BASI|nr:conserved hypothetical protein [Melanopsichium pennsylvanicum 4]SNX85345.1 uncharacterized protein MEPE_04054 [Melanopsichium pennsylvanicum]